ncbi:hypothetical protein [Albibacterium profundi]|uniref:Uncharacterized protein n=1 Tax=Albibacterium profundi TaxID=3134906 RepID=A0ABV5CGY9_9SPHI
MRKNLFVISAAVFLLCIVALLSGVFKAGKNLIDNPDVRSEKTTLYRDLFKEDIQDSLRSDNTSFNEYQEPYSVFTYKDAGNKFRIIVWKYATKALDDPLPVTLTETQNSRAIGQIYKGVKAGYYDIMITKDSVPTIKNMYLNLKGDDIVKIEYDGKLIYRLIPEKISVSNKKGGNEIWKVENVLHDKYKDRAEVAFFSDGTQCYLGFLIPLRKNTANEVSLANLLN